MADIEQFVLAHLPQSGHNNDEKYEKLQQDTAMREFNNIIALHQNALTQRLSDLTADGASITANNITSGGGIMAELFSAYKKHMVEGGILNAIGYRQNLGRVRNYLMDVISDKYVISSGAENFIHKLPQDSASKAVNAVYHGVIQALKLDNVGAAGINISAPAGQNASGGVSAVNSQLNCNLNLDQLVNVSNSANTGKAHDILDNHQYVSTLAVLNILLGKTEVQCSGFMNGIATTTSNNISNANPQQQTQSLDRLQMAGALLSNIINHIEQTKKRIKDNKDVTKTLQINSLDNPDINKKLQENTALLEPVYKFWIRLKTIVKKANAINCKLVFNFRS